MVKEMILRNPSVKAIGGSLPYDLCLAIKGIKAGEIEECEKQESYNALEEADMKLLNPGNSVKKIHLYSGSITSEPTRRALKVSLSLIQIRIKKHEYKRAIW